MSSVTIHPAALVEAGAELAEDVYIGPFCTVGRDVKLGARTRLISHVVMEGHVETGPDNIFYPFSVIGGPPQDLSYKNEPTRVVIGEKNVFREACTVHRGTMKDRQVTTIGSHNFIMGYCHIAHDCVLGNHIIMALQAGFAGHCQAGDYCIISGQVGVTQHVRIGEYAFLGAGTVLRRDLPPFMCAKEFSDVTGPNLVGLKRHGIREDEIRVICEIYKTLYLGKQTTENAITEIEKRFPDSPSAKRFVEFVRATVTGIQR